MQLQQVKASFKGQVKQLKASSILNYNSLLLRASIAFQDAPEQIELHYRPLPEKQDDPMVPLLGQKDFQQMVSSASRVKVFISEDLNASSAMTSYQNPSEVTEQSNEALLNKGSESVIIEVEREKDYRHTIRKLMDPPYKPVPGEAPLKQQDLDGCSLAFREEMAKWRGHFKNEIVNNNAQWRREFEQIKG